MGKGINLDALDEISKEIAEESGGTTFIKQKDMPEEWDVRLIEPLSNMNGLFFIRVRAFWIDKKKYISPATFKEPCPMMEEVMKALETGDKDLRSIVQKLDYKEESVEFTKIMNTEYHIPVFKMAEDGKGEITKLPEEKPYVLQCTVQLAEAIFKLAKHRNYKGTDDDGKDWFITDPKHGFNLTLTRTKGKNNRNEYDAQAGAKCEMPEWVSDPSKVYDIVTAIKKQMYSDDALRLVMKNYLYGDKLPKDLEKRFSDDEIKAQLPKEEDEPEKKVPAIRKKKTPAAEKKEIVKKITPKEEQTSMNMDTGMDSKNKSEEQAPAHTEEDDKGGISAEDGIDDL